jgi:hypothetical protein
MDADDDEAKDATDKKMRLRMLLGTVPSPSRLSTKLSQEIHIQVPECIPVSLSNEADHLAVQAFHLDFGRNSTIA